MPDVDATIAVAGGNVPAGSTAPAGSLFAAPETRTLPERALRDAVLSGRYFTAGHREAADALATFLASATTPLAAWFGSARAAVLAGDQIGRAHV